MISVTMDERNSLLRKYDAIIIQESDVKKNGITVYCDDTRAVFHGFVTENNIFVIQKKEKL